MTGPTGYYRRTLPAGRDPQALAVALARRETGPYVLYERDGEWSFAAGSHVELVLDHGGIRLRSGSRWTEVPLGGEPLQQVRELLENLDTADWRAYGWASFELGYLLHDPAAVPGPGTLLHLIVPEREARLRAGIADLRALRADQLADLEGALGEPAPSDPPAAVSVGERTSGGDGYRRLTPLS